MNRAAVYSKEVLERYDEAELKALEVEFAAEEAATRPRSGRLLSSQPYGTRREDKDMNECTSDALVRIKREAMHGGASSGPSNGQSIQIDSAHQSPALYPASLASGPGEDSARQIATLQVKLNQRLGPEYISTRQGPGGGGRLSYLEGWKAIDLANEVFGFNGWSSSVIRMDIDFLDEVEGKRYNVGVSAVVRITLRDGTFHEDLGYGHCENVKMKHQALEKARKEATTDALKRALRTFGRLLGNCLYDKKFVEAASRMKAAPPTYDVGSLKRNSDLPNASESSPASPPAVSAPLQQVQQKQQQQEPRPALQTRSSVQVDRTSTEQQSSHSSTTQAHSSAKPATTKSVASVASVVEQKSEEARLREERKAIAAAKQAALRQRKEEEEKVRLDAASKTMANNNAVKVVRASQDRRTSSSMRAEPSIEESFEDESVSFENGIDEYDLALVESRSDEDEMWQEEEISNRSVSKISRFPQTSRCVMDDSGIDLIDDSKAAHIRTFQKYDNATRGRFMDPTSSPSTLDRSNGRRPNSPIIVKHNPPTSSPKVPYRSVRRMSMVGVSSFPSGEKAQHSPGQPIQRSQRSKPQTTAQTAINYNRTGALPTLPGKRIASTNHSNAVEGGALKKLRPSQRR